MSPSYSTLAAVLRVRFCLDLETERSRFGNWSALDRDKDWERFVSWLAFTYKPSCNPSLAEGTDNSL
jgi:hypothetical protein